MNESQNVPFYTFAYNSTVHSETQYTPYELVYGRQCKLPSNLIAQEDIVYNYHDLAIDIKHKLQVAQNDARETLIRRKEERKTGYDQNYKTKNYEYESGDLIVVKNEGRKKMDPI